MVRSIRRAQYRCAIMTTLSLLSPCAIAPVRAQDRGARDEGSSQVVETKESVFSGPQTGEALPELPVWEVVAKDQPSEKVDLSALSAKAPIAILFMHEKSRPAFQLARIISTFLEQKKESKLQFFIVVLTDDRSSSEKWLGQIRHYMSKTTRFAVADGGLEGPGALGLNRLVSLTVLVANEQKVTANFALTQVTAATDGPPILKAINELAGGGEVPKIEDLLPKRQNRDR